MKKVLVHEQVQALARDLATYISKTVVERKGQIKIYGVPRGGVYAAYLVAAYLHAQVCTKPEEATFIIDDLIDSGLTRAAYKRSYPDKPFYALIDKHDTKYKGIWYVFPWELIENKDESFTDNVTRLLQYVGEDPMREGLLETPARVAKAWKQWTSGYEVDIAKLLKVFKDGSNGYDEMVIVKDIPIYSKCEHHLADIFGTATIAYIPNGSIVGLSKLSRLADAFARRLQVQERLTTQIANALDHHLSPKGVGVIIRARHMCMESRGICQQGHHTVTSALRGVLKTDPAARAEFLRLA